MAPLAPEVMVLGCISYALSRCCLFPKLTVPKKPSIKEGPSLSKFISSQSVSSVTVRVMFCAAPNSAVADPKDHNFRANDSYISVRSRIASLSKIT